MKQRLLDYLRFLAWQSGISYILLWSMTWWALDHGSSVFGGSGVCRIATVKILSYWACAPDSLLAVLAAAANAAFTLTIWAPVFVVLAVGNATMVPVAVPIVLAHVAGLPAAIYVVARVMLRVLALARRLLGILADAVLVSRTTARRTTWPAPTGPSRGSLWSSGCPSPPRT
jgi:hypothetical protein